LNKVFIAKQKIFNNAGKIFAYELLFRDSAFGIKELPTDVTATSNVLMNVLTNLDTERFLGKKGVAFINVDAVILQSGIIDILDKDMFVLELLETIDLTDEVVNKIQQYRKRGFRIALDDFDCSAEMIKKFTSIFKYIQIIKMDVISANPENLKNVFPKFKKAGKTLLAEKVETKEEYDLYKNMGFDLFQGYYLDKPEVIQLDRFKEATKIVILQLIKLIRDEAHTHKLEQFIKKQADLTFKLLKYLNNHLGLRQEVESVLQVITLLGRDKLLRWLLMYLYSELSNNPGSEIILAIAVSRAEKMEEAARAQDKDKAYLAGMFSMLEALFESDIKEIMRDINMDKEIVQLVVEKTGKFAGSLKAAQDLEREYLKTLTFNNFHSLKLPDIISALESSGITVDRTKL
jgi:EAL and modified HD-GYP domain-containing signal transduction protein